MATSAPPPRMDSTNNNSNTNNTNNNTIDMDTASYDDSTTTMAIRLHPSSSPSDATTSTHVTVWVGQGTTLRYYHYHDHSHQYPHTDALLQRYSVGRSAQDAVHLYGAGTSRRGGGGGGGSRGTATAKGPSDAATDRCLVVVRASVAAAARGQGVDDTTSYEDETDGRPTTHTAATPDTIVQLHEHCPSTDPSRLQQVLRQLFATNEAAFLQFQGDVEWQQHPGIAAGLVFYLFCQSDYPTVREDNHHHHNHNHNTLTRIDAGCLTSHLHVDSVAADAVHLWPPANAGQECHTGGTSATNSLYGVLARSCVTATGKVLLRQWLRHPLVDWTALQRRQAAVAALVADGVGRERVRQEGLGPLGGTPLTKWARTVTQYTTTQTFATRAALRALYDLYLLASQKIPRLVEPLEAVVVALGPEDGGVEEEEEAHEAHGGNGKKQPPILVEALQHLQQIQRQLAPAVELVEAVLDLDQAPREFLVQADYKDELRDIQRELEDCATARAEAHEHMNQLWCDATGARDAVKLVQDNNSAVSNGSDSSGWQFRLVNTNDSKILQQQLTGTVTVHRILKNGVYFTTSTLRQLSTQHMELRAEYDRHQRQVVTDALAVAATYAPVVVHANDWIQRTDVLAGLAHTAAYSPHGYCRPELTDTDADGAGLVLVGARHPCVELQASVVGEYIPNDVNLVLGESSFCLVTGPNMGGKSTYIRALGAIVILAQIGSFVPCTSAKINLMHHILARVGAGDLQDRGISTFMAEMLESSSILRTATKRSLIVIDELGRGTSTFDGYGLARAISEYICQSIGCCTVFATHFHELTALADDPHSVVQNCHVTAQTTPSQGLTFLYQVQPGPCLESFGIQVAELANVPAVVIADARRRARALERFDVRKKVRVNQEDNDNDTDNTTDTATTTLSPEAVAASQAAIDWMERFRNLPREALTKEYGSNDEKRTALLGLLQAS